MPSPAAPLIAPSGQPFAEIFEVVAQHIRTRYGMPVSICDVTSGFTGEFDGTEIEIDQDMDDEIRLYVLLHLFGHSVQWNSDASLRALGQEKDPKVVDPTLERVKAYEQGASELGLGLLHEAGVTNLDGWVSDWFAADWKYLEHLYQTGESLPFRSTFQVGAPLLSARPIPEFEPHAWPKRWSF